METNPQARERNEAPRKIIEKYGLSDGRKFIKYYQSNLPEKFWKSKIILEPQLDENIYVTYKSGKREEYKAQFISDLIKYQIKKGRTVKRYSFFDLMSKVVRFAGIDINCIMEEISECDIVVIDGVEHGIVYDKYVEVFPILLKEMMNTRMKKNIIITIKWWSSKGEMSSVYGGLLTDILTGNEFLTARNYYENLNKEVREFLIKLTGTE